MYKSLAAEAATVGCFAVVCAMILHLSMEAVGFLGAFAACVWVVYQLVPRQTLAAMRTVMGCFFSAGVLLLAGVILVAAL